MRIKRIFACMVASAALMVGSCVPAMAATDIKIEDKTATEAEKTSFIELPVVVSADLDVNALAIAVNFDSNVLTPVAYDKDVLDADRYSSVSGTALESSSSVLTGDLNSEGNTILIGWADSTAKTVSAGQEIVKVKFAVKDSTAKSTDVSVGIVQVAKDANTLYGTNDFQTTALAGKITLGADVLYGDINSDGNVNSTDAGLASQSSMGLITLTASQIQAGDVNGDGVVNSTDAGFIAQFAVKYISKFPIQG